MMEVLKQLLVIPNMFTILVYITIVMAGMSFILHLSCFLAKIRYRQNILINELKIISRWCLWLAILSGISTIPAGYYGYTGSHKTINNENKEYNTNIQNDKIPLYWIDPMEPGVHYAKAGKSAMGMELVPVYPKTKDNDQPKNSIKIPQGYIDNLGVVTAPVINSNITNQISTYAYVESNESKIAYITSYTNGWVRNLIVKNSGATVKKGQLLAQIYSPTIINAQQEYLMAIQSDNKLLAMAALKKLNTFHVSDTQIQQLQKSKAINQLINIYAPQNGIIAELNVREGDYVTPETKLFNVLDLSSIWLIASVFEKQSQWLKVGNAAVAKFAAYPDKSWQGTVEYIYPQLDPQTRTLKARLHFDNPGLVLKPNMYANIIIATSPKLGKLSIPEEAVIYDVNGNRVVVALGNGLFQVRKITIGEETNGQVEVLSGLNLGELVVKSGEFMLDSEASLNSAIDKLDSSESISHD